MFYNIKNIIHNNFDNNISLNNNKLIHLQVVSMLVILLYWCFITVVTNNTSLVV